MTLLTNIFGMRGTSEYTSNLESIRRRGSIDITDIVTSEELPDAVIEDVSYLEAAEVELISDLKTDVAGINSMLSDDTKKRSLRNLLIVRTVLKMLPQFIQITSKKVLSRGEDYSKMDWTAKETFLQNEYNKTLVIVTPSTPVASGTIGINVVSTSSRLED